MFRSGSAKDSRWVRDWDWPTDWGSEKHSDSGKDSDSPWDLLGWLVYVGTRPPMPLLGREAGTQVFRDLDEHADDETFPGIAVLRLDRGSEQAAAKEQGRAESGERAGNSARSLPVLSSGWRGLDVAGVIDGFHKSSLRV